MSEIIVLMMIILFFLGGMAVLDISQAPTKGKKLSAVIILVIAFGLCLLLPTVRDMEAINMRNDKMVKEAMGKTKYQVISKENEIYRILTDDNHIFSAKIIVEIKEVKPKGKGE